MALTVLALLPAALFAQGLAELQHRDGLVVFVGVPDKQLLASVRQNWEWLVQVLVPQTDEKTELNMRSTEAKLGLSRDGRTTLLEYSGRGLPYCDNSVNRVVVAGPSEVARAELMRILVPRGTLVTVGGEVYVTLGFEAPVSVLDAATGETKATLPGTEGTEEILVSNGVVLVVTGGPKAELRDWAGAQRDFTTGEKHKRGLVAVNAATRELLWQRRDRQTATVLPMSLAVKEGRGFFVNAQGVTGFDLNTGEQLWQTAEPVAMRRQAKFAPTDVIVIDNTVWYTSTPAMLEGNFKEGRDLRTGEVIKTINGPDINHGRCYRNKATSRYLLGGKNGLDFIDPDSPRTRHVPRGMRGTCQLGVLPCNGLIYLPPHACVCEPERKLNGFLAVSQGTERPYPDPSQQGPRFRPGPAFGQVQRPDAGRAEDEWPTFRHALLLCVLPRLGGRGRQHQSMLGFI